ncbi:channel protein, MIP family [Dictyocaulus viviparus]|uniref:Channel protein, MIP family n=1 Tax=Dictyocaulus viviparus TaxID=29172 RepID=A0A0D8XJD7_DICVI|nr:channel protein, MIP family [Dictyocaulus viviparus]
MSAQPEPYSVSTKCAAEFVAVMAFVVVGSLQALNTHDGILHAALSHGVAIFVLVSVFAHISGGHINPAVTLGLAVAGKMTPLEAICYVISQLAGGVLGALLVRSLLTYDQYVAIQGGATLCGPNITWYQGVVAEALATFLLVQTVLVTAVDSTTALAPLAIGFTIIMDILAVGSISGASMNPGRSFGPNIIATIFMYEKLAGTFWTLHWIYYLGPSIGALVAVGLYRLFFAKDDRILL